MTAAENAYRRFSRDPFSLPTNEQLADLEWSFDVVFRATANATLALTAASVTHRLRVMLTQS